ncbi:MAG TPA: glycosyltransferase family 4 protein [Gammaproteobacteria bacterium]
MRAKLCIIVPAHWEALMGGSQYQAKVLVDYLLAHYDVEIVYLTTRANPKFRPAGYRIVPFSDRRGVRRYGSFFDAARLYRALARESPDVILQFVGSAHTGIAALYARRHGCKMIWRVTNDPSVEPDTTSWLKPHLKLERLCLRFGIRNATLILAQTRYQRDRLAEHFPHAPVQVLPNFHPTPPDCGRSGAVMKQVAWIANLKPLKNPGAFVRLARRFAHRSDVHFVIVGGTMDGGDWATQQLKEIAATPNLEYRGQLSQAAVNSLLEHTDLLVNTSDYEGFSNTFIQAWMRRVPVVSLRVDPDRLLSLGGLGAVTGDEDALYERVAALLGDPDRCAAIGARARRYALEHHAESNVETLARLLDLERWLNGAVAARRFSR